MEYTLLTNLWTYVVVLFVVIIVLILYKRGVFKHIFKPRRSRLHRKLNSEERIAKRASELIQKEKDLQSQEKEIQKQIDLLTVEAEHLAGVNKHVEGKNDDLVQLQQEVEVFRQEIDDVKKVLAITDELLEKLPADEIDTFVSSDKFTLYQKIMKKYKLGK